MKKRTYICIILSKSGKREYEVETKSAIKCADKYGKLEFGEVVMVSQKNGKLLSCCSCVTDGRSRWYQR